MGFKTCSAGFCLVNLGILGAVAVSPAFLFVACFGGGLIIGSGIMLAVDCLTDRE